MNGTIRIGLCQFRSPSEIGESLAAHRARAVDAADRGCDLILFPELSLTGYEPGIASANPLDADDPRLDAIAGISVEGSITVALGLPLRAGGGTQIGMFVCSPDGSRSTYAKQLLHTDEKPYFVPGDRTHDLTIARHRIALAICFESMQPPHGEKAVARGATIYAASVAKHKEGMDRAHQYFAAFAAQHAIPVVLVNAVGLNDGFVSSGGSAAWGPDGSLIGGLGSDEETLAVDLPGGSGENL